MPPGATAVGHRPACRRPTTRNAPPRPAAPAAGFAAYAIAADVNDPVVQLIHKLLDHAAASDARIDRLIEQLSRQGTDCGDTQAVAEAFDPQQINKMLD